MLIENNYRWSERQTGYLVYLIVCEGLSRRDAAKRINEVFGTSYTKNSAIGRCDRIGINDKDMTHYIVVGSLVQLYLDGYVEFTEELKVKLTEEGRNACIHYGKLKIV